MADPKNKARDYDLPDPELNRSTVYKSEDQQRNLNRLIKIAVVGVTAYSILHKLVVPGLLKFTTVSQVRYKEIDESWVFGLLFCISVFVGGSQRQLVRAFGAGCAISLGLHELIRFYNGDNTGWLGLSRALSSGPMAFLGIVILFRMLSEKGRFVMATLSCVVSLGFMTVVEYIWSVPAQTPTPVDTLADSREVFLISKLTEEVVPACGAREIHLLGRSEVPKPKNKDDLVLDILVEGCGFKPSLGYFGLEKTKIQFTNNLSRSLNIHLWIYKRSESRRSSMNFVIPPGAQSKTLEGEVFQDSLAVLIVSDNHREMGMTLLLDASVVDRKISAQAYPPRLKIEGVLP
jgi:hypothetical protein